MPYYPAFYGGAGGATVLAEGTYNAAPGGTEATLLTYSVASTEIGSRGDFFIVWYTCSGTNTVGDYVRLNVNFNAVNGTSSMSEGNSQTLKSGYILLSDHPNNANYSAMYRHTNDNGTASEAVTETNHLVAFANNAFTVSVVGLDTATVVLHWKIMRFAA